jgi:hypothetical protein
MCLLCLFYRRQEKVTCACTVSVFRPLCLCRCREKNWTGICSHVQTLIERSLGMTTVSGSTSQSHGFSLDGCSAGCAMMRLLIEVPFVATSTPVGSAVAIRRALAVPEVARAAARAVAREGRARSVQADRSNRRMSAHVARGATQENRVDVTACGSQFTIDDAGSCREPEDGRGDPREPTAEVAAIPAVMRCTA